MGEGHNSKSNSGIGTERHAACTVHIYKSVQECLTEIHMISAWSVWRDSGPEGVLGETFIFFRNTLF